MPVSPHARLLFSLGNAFDDNRPALQPMLEKAGYKVTSALGTLESLSKDIVGDGYFYWASHSGWLEIKGDCSATSTSCTQPVWIIATATEWSAAADATDFIKDLRKNHLISLAGASWDRVPNPVDTNKNGKIDEEERVTHKTVYAIRPEFVSTRFKFSDSSTILQDGCTSAAKPFSDAYFAANAGMYLGWDKVTFMGPKMALFTDRLLGSNTVPPVEDPPERPFSQRKVIDWMRAKGLDGSGSGSKLQVAINPGNAGPEAEPGILAPSIQFMSVDDGLFQGDPGTLTLSGEFGQRDDGKYKREVFLAGKSLHIQDGGDNWTIIADLKDGDPAGGPVVAIIGGRISNEVPLSLYDIHMTYEFVGADSLRISQNVHYKVRMDVHRSREDVGVPPVGRLEPFRSRKDSSAFFTASGTANVATCQFTWSGSGPIVVPTVPAGSGLLLGGVVDLATGTFPAFMPTSEGGPVTEVVTCPPGSSTTSTLQASIRFDNNPVATMNMSTYALMAGSATYTNARGNGTLNWYDSLPLYPPTATTKD